MKTRFDGLGWLVVFLLLWLTLDLARGQAGVPAINPALLTKTWPANWIAPPAVSLKEHGVYHLRRTLDLAEVPGSFVVHVSADNRYQLFANGELASLGRESGRGETTAERESRRVLPRQRRIPGLCRTAAGGRETDPLT